MKLQILLQPFKSPICNTQCLVGAMACKVLPVYWGNKSSEVTGLQGRAAIYSGQVRAGPAVGSGQAILTIKGNTLVA